LSKLKRTRLWSQIFFFFLFCTGILLAGHEKYPLPFDLFFFLDPLAAIITIGASGIIISGLLISIITILLTIVFGRFFCSWICPLGSLIDFAEFISKSSPDSRTDTPSIQKLSRIKFGILIFVLAGSVFSFQFIYLLDPIVIMTRFMGMIISPLKSSFLQKDFFIEHSIHFILFTAAVLGLSLFARRFWCRVICPLGALFGLLSRFSIFKLENEKCVSCPSCVSLCRTEAMSDQGGIKVREEECIRCFDCIDGCSTDIWRFKAVKNNVQDTPQIHMSRRKFLAWGGSAVIGSTMLTPFAPRLNASKDIIRPPFAPDEEKFLDLCIRCQACVNTCPTNALQPLFMELGLYGLWSPRIKPLIGPCKTGCAKCSEVCPTGAIGVFSARTKYTIKMGTASLLKGLCIPYNEGKKCGKCIPECPTGAIEYINENGMDKPLKIDYLLCTGCGICESLCNQMTLGPPALITTDKGRNQPSGVDISKLRLT
jgi:polyferredoxin